jgi:hypothetical protein
LPGPGPAKTAVASLDPYPMLRTTGAVVAGGWPWSLSAALGGAVPRPQTSRLALIALRHQHELGHVRKTVAQASQGRAPRRPGREPETDRTVATAARPCRTRRAAILLHTLAPAQPPPGAARRPAIAADRMTVLAGHTSSVSSPAALAGRVEHPTDDAGADEFGALQRCCGVCIVVLARRKRCGEGELARCGSCNGHM